MTGFTVSLVFLSLALVVGSHVLDRRTRLARWIRWRLDRPRFHAGPSFPRQLADWQLRRPRKARP